MLGTSQYGESSNPSALPWDVIKSTPFQRASDVTDKLIVGLNKSYQERTKFDASLRKYIVETEDLKKNLAQTRISLNEVKRKEEMVEAEKKKELNEKLNTRISREGLPNDLQKMEDEYLRESLLILTELVTKRIG